MSKHFLWIWLLIGTPVGLAQDSDAPGHPPPPTDTGQPPSLPSPSGSSPEADEGDVIFGEDHSTDPDDDSISELEHELSQLQAEREAVGRLRLQTALERENLERAGIGATIYHRQMLQDLLNYVARGGIYGRTERAPKTTPAETATVDIPPPSTPQPVDLMALGKLHFRQGDFDQALVMFRRIAQEPPEQQTVQDHLFLQYMIATCLRKLESFNEALDVYSEVATSEDDEIIARYAKWQMELIRWRERLKERTTDLKQSTDHLIKLIEEMELSASAPSQPTEPAPAPPTETEAVGEEL